MTSIDSDDSENRRAVPRGYARILLMAARPHFFAFPMGAALAGAASQQPPLSAVRLSLALAGAALGWGVGQLLNDVFDREADAIDAPERPGVRGLLPTVPTLSVAVAVGLLVAAVVVMLHPRGWLLGLCAMVLIGTYNLFKRIPLLGNVSHGLVMSLACLIGAAAVAPQESLWALVVRARLPLALTFLWAGLYLAANYEKDRRGDAAAGYWTAAHVLGVRGSAVVRAGFALGIFAVAMMGYSDWWTRSGLAVSVALVLLSSAQSWRGGDEAAALRGYRAAVHGGAFGMLSLGASAVSPLVLVGLLLFSGALTEAAFRRTDNP